MQDFLSTEVRGDYLEEHNLRAVCFCICLDTGRWNGLGRLIEFVSFKPNACDFFVKESLRAKLTLGIGPSLRRGPFENVRAWVPLAPCF